MARYLFYTDGRATYLVGTVILQGPGSRNLVQLDPYPLLPLQKKSAALYARAVHRLHNAVQELVEEDQVAGVATGHGESYCMTLRVVICLLSTLMSSDSNPKAGGRLLKNGRSLLVLTKFPQYLGLILTHLSLKAS